MSEDKVINLGRVSRTKHNKYSLTNRENLEDSEKVFCNFCGRSEDEVLKMVKGPGVNICSECTMIAVQYLILEDKMVSSEAQKILDAFWGHLKV